MNGRRGSVRGREMMWVVRGVGCVWVRHAREKDAAVVGTSARRS